MGAGLGITLAFIVVLMMKLKTIQKKTKPSDDSFHHWYNNRS